MIPEQTVDSDQNGRYTSAEQKLLSRFAFPPEFTPSDKTLRTFLDSPTIATLTYPAQGNSVVFACIPSGEDTRNINQYLSVLGFPVSTTAFQVVGTPLYIVSGIPTASLYFLEDMILGLQGTPIPTKTQKDNRDRTIVLAQRAKDDEALICLACMPQKPFTFNLLKRYRLARKLNVSIKHIPQVSTQNYAVDSVPTDVCQPPTLAIHRTIHGRCNDGAITIENFSLNIETPAQMAHKQAALKYIHKQVADSLTALGNKGK